MENPFQSKHFWILTGLIAAILFIFFINYNRSYKTESEILIIPKNDQTSRTINQIVANATKIPLTLAFYDNVIRTNEDIIFQNPAESAAKRKARWQSQLIVERAGDSSIIKITTFSSSRFQSELLNEQVLDGIISDLSRLYDIKTAIDARILDSLITNNNLQGSYTSFILLSILLALAISILIYYLLIFIYQRKISSETFPRPKINFPNLAIPGRENIITESLDYFQLFPKSKKEDQPEVKKSLKTIDPKIQDNKEVIATGIKKAPAPGNLPVASEEDVFKVKKNLYPQEKIEEKILKEPTEEEVKERLNKLLSGKF